MLKAKIIKSARREFECLIIESNEIVQAKAKGSLLNKGDQLVVGDIVQISLEQDEYFIQDLIPRKNTIFRRIIRENKTKVIASNIDLLAIVCTVSKPEYKRGLIDRYLLRAVQWEVPAIVIFNKMDETCEIDLDFEVNRLKPLEVQCFATSAVSDDYKHPNLPGNKELSDFLKDQTIIFLGQSGVGKSKLISHLSNEDIVLLSKELASVGKGAHTTTWSELVHLKDFDIIDSPGIRTMSIQDVNIDELTSLFPDLEPYFIQCKFKDCHHEPSTKGCAFFKSEMNKQIISRLDSYKRFKKEISEIPQWQKN